MKGKCGPCVGGFSVPWSFVWWASTSTFRYVNPQKVDDEKAYSFPFSVGYESYEGFGSFYGELIVYDRSKDIGIYLALPVMNRMSRDDKYAIVFFRPSDLENHTINHPFVGRPVSNKKWHHLSKVEEKFEGINPWKDPYFKVKQDNVSMLQKLYDFLNDRFYSSKSKILWSKIVCKDGKEVCDYVIWNKEAYEFLKKTASVVVDVINP